MRARDDSLLWSVSQGQRAPRHLRGHFQDEPTRNMRAMISVLMATYNGLPYVLGQLESIRTQSTPVDEVIISDDGSTDGTVAVVRQYIDEHNLQGWTLHENQQNLGPAGNCFSLLRRASGDLVFLSDQDDVWEENKVATVAEHFKHHASVVAVASSEVLIDCNGELISDGRLRRRLRRPTARSSGWIPLAVDDFAGSSRIPWHAICVNRKVIETALSAGAPEVSRTLGADWYVGLVACLTGDFHLLGEPLVRWRIHGSNASLGRLGRRAVLSTGRDRRVSMLEEVLEAHRYVLGSRELAVLLAQSDRTTLEGVVAWQAVRATFTRSPTPQSVLALVRSLGMYRRSLGSYRAAIRGLGADLLYASPLAK